MTDEIYEQCVAVEETFNTWWRGYDSDCPAAGRSLAQAAYRAGWEARHEHVKSEMQADWHRLAAVVRETTDLAQRHNLVIGSFQNKPASPRVIRAERSGFCVEAPNWSALLALLKGMEKQGDL